MISDFFSVSVREKSGIDIIKDFNWNVNCSPQLVLDPTFLLDKEDYLKHFQVKKLNQLFCYILDKNEKTRDLISKTEKILHISSFDIMEGINNRKFVYQPSIETWLSNIYNSKFILTDSFHGMVFCIIFNKPFAVCVNHDRGADRFLSLLSLLNLETRMIKDVTDINKVLVEPICWSSVNKCLAQLKNASLKFLNSSLKNKI